MPITRPITKPRSLVLRLSDDERAALEHEARNRKQSLSETARGFIADGMRWQMEHGHGKEPISTPGLMMLADGAIAEFYLQHSDAVCASVGVVGPLGSKFRFKTTKQRAHYDPPVVYWVVDEDDLDDPTDPLC